ncbi:hypothetical protein JCM8547_004876 [Rhodosporidiobolus lusitaniae]
MVSAAPSTSAGSSSQVDASIHLLQKMAPQLDRHLLLPLLDFLESREKYSHDEVLQAKVDLLGEGKTNMVTFVEGLKRELEGKGEGEEVEGATEFRKREQEVVKSLNELQAQAQAVMEVISNPEVVSALRQDKQHNLTYLKDNHNIGLEQIAHLYKFGQFQYSIGHYAGASDYLYHFRVLSTDSSLVLSAMWGKLGADILEGAWDAALEELNGLREHIDQRGGSGPGGPLLALQQRTWWLHWSLFVYYNHPNGRELLIESWLNQNYLNTIQTAAPWLLRYLVAAVVISRKSTLRSAGPAPAGNSARSREAVRDVVRALGQEQYQYSDAVTEFLRKLYGEVDFAGAREEMARCGGEGALVLDDDFFLEPFKAEFVENARYLVSEAYCKIHRRIDIGELSDRLGLTREDGERWIVDLVRDARLDAKIDLKQNIVQMNHSEQPVYQTVIEKSRGLLFRSQAMASAIEVRASGGNPDRDQSSRPQGARGGQGNKQGGARTGGQRGPAGGKKQDESSSRRRARLLPSTAPNDRFSSLSVELLRESFHLAYPEDGARPSSPLSKSLLPFYLEVVYQDRAELIQKLRTFVKYSETPKREGKDTRSPSNKTLIGIFKLLTKLRTLQVFGSSRIAQLTVSSQVAGDCFPHLEELLLNSLKDLDDPFHLSTWTNLVFYRTLDTFELVVTNRTPQFIKPLAKPSYTPGILLPPIFSVTLDGPLSASPGALGLVEALNGPPIFSLRDFDSLVSIVPLLKAADLPEDKLCLRVESWQQTYDPALLDALLRFTGFDLLEHLVLGDGVMVSTANLESLVSGPKKHKSLKRLALDNIGGDLEDDDYKPGWTQAYNAVEKFIRTIRECGARAQLVKGLDVEISWADEAANPTSMWKQESPTPLSLRRSDVVLLFPQLTKATQMRIKGSSYLAEIFLSSEVAAGSFPELANLHLDSTFSSFSNPFHPVHYASLPYFPKLDDLHLVVNRTGESLEFLDKPLPTILPSLLFQPFLCLCIEGPLDATPAGLLFLSCLSHVFDLTLIDFETERSPNTLLRAVSKPQSLNYLTLVSAPNHSYGAPLEQALLRFTSLKSLALGGCPSASASFHDTLRNLPTLKSLNYGPETAASTEELIDLISGPRKHPVMKELKLAMVWVVRGTRIFADARGEPYYPEDDYATDDDFGVYPDWMPPMWTSTFTFEGAKTLKRVAEEVGVELVGSVVEAIEVEEGWRREVDYVEELEMMAAGVKVEDLM